MRGHKQHTLIAASKEGYILDVYIIRDVTILRRFDAVLRSFSISQNPDCFRGPEEVRNAFVGSKSLADRREIQLPVLLLQYN